MNLPLPSRLCFLPLLLAFNLAAQALPAFSQIAPARLANHLAILDSAIHGEVAYDAVSFFQKYWRHGGNQDFNLCMDYLAGSLRSSGYTESDGSFRLTVFDTKVEDEMSWQPFSAELRIITPVDTLLHALTQAKMTLCINSHSTPLAGFTGELVRIGGNSNIVAGSLAGKIAYTHESPPEIFDRAVKIGGAAGIISAHLPAYNQPETHRTSISMSSIPYLETPRAFGFKISYGSRDLIDSLLRQGPVRVKAEVLTQFAPKVVREVTAEIIGRQKPQETIALIAHVDEPGANDNASGSAALLEIAAVLRELINAGKLPPLNRTLRMMWVEEIHTIERWQRAASQEFAEVKAALVLDMVGEDVTKTGGTFLIEKSPDPSALWTRPPDAHTEWGSGSVNPEHVRGSYLNDLFGAACEQHAARRNWQIKTNPYEGGSDHVPFVKRGVPAVLAWHFTDVFYHTSGDEIDKVSPQEMANVAISIAATALFISNCNRNDAEATLRLLEKRAHWRLENETHNGLENLRAGESNLTEEEKILNAWQHWYAEAFESVKALPVEDDRKKLAAIVQRAQEKLSDKRDEQSMIIKRFEK